MSEQEKGRDESVTPGREISGGSVVVAAKDQVFCDLAEEAVILNLQSGVYYGLNSLGARVWSLIQEPRTVSELQGVILEEYEVEPERCERDLLALLRKLVDAGLVELKGETSG